MTLLTVALTLSIVSQAQSKNGKVSGSIIDGNTKTIESATITLLKAKDSSVAKISFANNEGNFVFEKHIFQGNNSSHKNFRQILNDK